MVMPKNAQIYYGLCYYLASFQIIPMDTIADKLRDKLNISSDEVKEERRRLADTEENSSLLIDDESEEYDSEPDFLADNLLTIVLLALVLCFVIILVPCFICCRKVKCMNSCLNKIWRKVFFNMIIRSWLETSLVLAITSITQLYDLYFNKNAMDTMASLYTILAVALLVIFTITVPIFLHRRRE